MILPRDQVLYAGLRASFTNFDALVEDLQARRLSGYVTFTDTGVEATVLFDGPAAGIAWVQSGRGQLGGAEARAEIAAQAGRGTGTIDVFALDSALVRLIASLEQREAVHRDLSTAFTSPEGLLSKLREDRLSGCVEMSIEGSKAAATIYLCEGTAVAAIFLQDGQAWSGPDAVTRALAAAAAHGAMFNVFRPGGWTPAYHPEQPTHAPALRAEAAISSFSPYALTAIAPAGLDMLAFWSEMLGVAEGVVDSLGPAGKFSVAFREARVERADVYPFLDPFAADFDYRDGAVTFSGPLPAEFSEALGECLQDALARLAFRLKRADVETRVHAELAELGGRNAAVMESFPLSVQALVS